MNREDLFEELMIKNQTNKSLQHLAGQHILTGPDKHTIDDLTKILQPIRKIRNLHLYENQQGAVYTMLEDKSPEEAYKTIHTVYGRFPEIEDQLVIIYSIEVLEHEVFNNFVEGDLTRKELNICSRIKTEIRNIGCKRKMTIIQRLVKQPLDRFPLPVRRSLCFVTWITLVLYHEQFTQHSSIDESEEYPHLIKGLIAALDHDNRTTCVYLPYYFETCFDLQTTSPEQCLSIVSNMYDSNLSSARKIKLGLVKHLQSKQSPDMLKSNEFKVIMFIVKWEELKWFEFERKNILQMKNELESVLTSTDTTNLTEMLMKYTQELCREEVQVYITLMTWEVLVTRGKHEQLAVVSNYLDAITHGLEPDLLRFFCKTCIHELNPKEKVEWIQKHYCEQLPVIGALLKVEVYIELLMKMDYVTLMEISLADDQNICQPTFINKLLLHPKSRVDLELVSFIINNKAISNRLFKELSCDRLSAYIKLLLHLYAKENKPETKKVLKIIKLSTEEPRHCTDSDRVCHCHIELTKAASHDDFFGLSFLQHPYTSGMSREEELQSNINCMYENPSLASIENMKATWANLLITDDITKPILEDFIYLMIMKCKKIDIALLVLGVNISKCKYLDLIITLIAPVLQIGGNVKYDKFIYKCFCIVRYHYKVYNASKKANSNHRSLFSFFQKVCSKIYRYITFLAGTHPPEKAISKYREAFPFLKAMEANDEMEKLSTYRTIAVLMILLLLSSALGSTSSQLKKYLSLKYEYEDAILYLLWCSGDVEINPGPTLKKLRKVPDSQKERSWIYDTCSVLQKVLRKKDLEAKKKKEPSKLLSDQPFYDPRNKPKGAKYTSRSDANLLKNLYKMCKKIEIPQHIHNEIQAWMSRSKNDLFEQFISRTECKTLSEAVQALTQYKDDKDLKKHLHERKIYILPAQRGSSKPTKHYTDIVRDLATTICRLIKGFELTEKTDGIWKTPPPGWNLKHKYYSPCTTKKRTEKDQDTQLLNNLIIYCESKGIFIPPELSAIVKAWKDGNSNEVHKLYTIWANVCIIDHSLKYLEIEKYLDTQQVQQCLVKIGISRSTAKNQEDLGKHPSKSTEQPKSKTDLGASSNINQNDTETPSTSNYNKDTLKDRGVSLYPQQRLGPNTVVSSPVQPGVVGSDVRDESQMAPITLDQSAKTQERKSVKRKNIITDDQVPVKKVVIYSVKASVNKNPKKDTHHSSKSTNSVSDSSTHTTRSDDNNTETDKDNTDIPQTNLEGFKTSTSKSEDQSHNSPFDGQNNHTDPSKNESFLLIKKSGEMSTLMESLNGTADADNNKETSNEANDDDQDMSQNHLSDDNSDEEILNRHLPSEELMDLLLQPDEHGKKIMEYFAKF